LNLLSRRFVDVVAKIVVTYGFTHAGKFLEIVLASLGVNRQINQFQSPENGAFNLILVALSTTPLIYIHKYKKFRV